MNYKIEVAFYVEAPSKEYAETIVRRELDDNKQIFKKWYNQHDNSNGIVAYGLNIDQNK